MGFARELVVMNRLGSWMFSIVLGAVYLSVFEFWMRASRTGVVVSAGVATLGLVAGFVMAWRRRYFVNKWDALAHGSVIADIVLEAALIQKHDHLGFLLCFVAFVLVIGGYRLYWLRKR